MQCINKLYLSPWSDSGDRTPAARTAALTRYRYATQPTNFEIVSSLKYALRMIYVQENFIGIL